MGDTSIEWTDKSWSPVTGCKAVSPGCLNCYAARLSATRLKGLPAYSGLAHLGGSGRAVWSGGVRLHPDRLEQPLHWREPKRVFVCDMSDLFHEDVPVTFLDEVFAVIALCRSQTFQVLTKRPERMKGYSLDEETPGRVARAADRLAVSRAVARMGPERILPVPGWPSYYASDRGRILSAKRGELYAMSPETGHAGHQRVMLYRDDGLPERHLVHRLVLSTFVRLPEDNEQGCHRDGNPSNNALPNLRWGSQADNWADRKRHGNGRSHSLLSLQEVEEIKGFRAAHMSKEGVAQRFGISATQVTHIERGEQWAARSDWPLPNCWYGVSVEDQRRAEERVPLLCETPAAVRFLSCEPLLGPLGLSPWLPRLGWLICGGESGPGARPMDPAWALDLAAQCRRAGVAYFCKQMGSVAARRAGWRDAKGADPADWAEPLLVRQYPVG